MLSGPLYPELIPVVARAKGGQFVTPLCRAGWVGENDVALSRRQLKYFSRKASSPGRKLVKIKT